MQTRQKTIPTSRFSRDRSGGSTSHPSAHPRTEALRAALRVSSAEPSPGRLEALAEGFSTLCEHLGTDVAVARATTTLNTTALETLECERGPARTILLSMQQARPGSGYAVICHGGLVDERVSPRMRFWMGVQDELLRERLV